MKHFDHKRIVAGLAAAGLLAVAAPAYALSSSSNTQTATQQQHLANIKTRGDQEITRRLNSLNKLDSKITSAKHLTAADQSSLESEVNTEVSGLTALKSKLDNETALSGAITDAKSIFSDYRVYALITPKVWLVRTADDQQTVESKLTVLAAKLQTRLTSAQNSGKNVASLQADLSDLNTQVSASQAISSSIESKVINLQPSDYNSDHSILSGDRAQLQTARADNLKAISDAKAIVQGLKSLK